MKRDLRETLAALEVSLVLLAGSVVGVPRSVFADLANCDADGLQASGAVYRICMPPPGFWNGDLVVYAHGFISPTEPVAIPEEHLVLGDTTLPELAALLGFAFATTSYSTNGFAVPEGLADVVDVVDIFAATYGPPVHTLLIGSSQGGLITALALEQHADVFDGGLSVCGPVGDFSQEINYIGDFGLLFSLFFPDVVPMQPTGVPQKVMEHWETVYVPAVRQAIWSDLPRTMQLLRVARAPVDLFDPENLLASIDQTVLTLLWYNVFATNDAIEKLGGPCYDNTKRWYRGTQHDAWLNKLCPRFAADPVAIENLEAGYITAGDLGAPIVTLHTLLDEVVPYRQQLVYRRKNAFHGVRALNTHVPAPRYGHCVFTADELLFAFGALYETVTGDALTTLGTTLEAIDSDVPIRIGGPPGFPEYTDANRALLDRIDLQQLAGSAGAAPLRQP